jgi:hypothetical protein
MVTLQCWAGECSCSQAGVYLRCLSAQIWLASPWDKVPIVKLDLMHRLPQSNNISILTCSCAPCLPPSMPIPWLAHKWQLHDSASNASWMQWCANSLCRHV